jgi:hypothetical protein
MYKSCLIFVPAEAVIQKGRPIGDLNWCKGYVAGLQIVN